MTENAKSDALEAEFQRALRESGLELKTDEVTRMREGFTGLKGLRARLPRSIPMAVEPAIIALPPGARSTK